MIIDFTDLFRRAATYVDKILKGTKPADLSCGATYEVRVGDQSEGGKQIGLTIPQSVLYQADKVIK
jgi:putative ABC transport system substrate-binding protein